MEIIHNVTNFQDISVRKNISILKKICLHGLEKNFLNCFHDSNTLIEKKKGKKIFFFLYENRGISKNESKELQIN